MRRLIRALTDGLALLLGLSPNQRLLAVVLAAAGVVTLNWFSNATLVLLEGPARWNSQFWVALLGLPAVLLAFLVLAWQAWRRTQPTVAQPVMAAARPVPGQGLIVFLSTFNTFEPKLPPERWGERWKGDELLAALAADRPDWPRILDHVMASNMQTPLEAIRYHLEAGTLHHVWVLATSDIPGEGGKVARAGSHRLAGAFERILREGMGWHVSVHDHRTQAELIVPPYDVQKVFTVVDRIYREEAPREGVRPDDVIADVTGGTVTMTAGMLLACALFSRKVQFTAAENDPTQGKPLERPTPYAIQVDEAVLRRLMLRHLAAVEV